MSSPTEFIMKHKLAILIAVLILVLIVIPFMMFFGLNALAMFNTSEYTDHKASGFLNFQASDWKLGTDGTFTLSMNNRAGKAVKINEITVGIGQTTVPIIIRVPDLADGASTGMLSTATGAFGSQAPGKGYAATVQIKYFGAGYDMEFTEQGKLTDKIS